MNLNHMHYGVPEPLGTQTVIAVGARVGWTRSHTHNYQVGTVTALLRDIGNGQLVAVINVDHELPGIVEMIPITELCILHNETEAACA